MVFYSFDKRPVILLGGPTASGKSSLALDMANQMNGAIINADAIQLYAHFAVLSARPNAGDLARAPHYLYGILPHDVQTTAPLWRDKAMAEIRTCHERGQVPILVGGTGFYLKIIQDGLPFIPPVPPEIQAHVQGLLQRHGSVHLHGCLGAVDGEIATRIHPHDTQRIMRAYGVFISSKRPLSYWQKQPHDCPLKDHKVITYSLLPDKETLALRARTRLTAMLEGGAIDEVAAFMVNGIRAAETAKKVLGFSEIAAYLQGVLTRDQAFDQTLQETMHYIKRQRTWFRAQIKPDTHVLSSSSSDWRCPLGRLC